MSNGIGVFDLAGYVVAILAIVTIVGHVVAFATARLTGSTLGLVPYSIGAIAGLVALVTWWTVPGVWVMSDDSAIGVGTFFGSAVVIVLSSCTLMATINKTYHNRR